jgi:hypothetical protein
MRAFLGKFPVQLSGLSCAIFGNFIVHYTGKKELREINMEFNARYIKDDDIGIKHISAENECMRDDEGNK